MKIVVKHKPGCPKCRFTMNYLDQHHFEFKDILIHPEEDRKAIQELLDEGDLSFPVVYVYSDKGNLIDHWDDLRMDELKKLQFIDD